MLTRTQSSKLYILSTYIDQWTEELHDGNVSGPSYAIPDSHRSESSDINQDAFQPLTTFRI